MINCLPIYPEKPVAGVLQSGAVCCNLQSARKLNLNKISNLFEFADCRDQIAESACNLLNIPCKSIGYIPIPDCTRTPLYLRYRNPLTFLTSVSRFRQRQPNSSSVSGVGGDVVGGTV